MYVGKRRLFERDRVHDDDDDDDDDARTLFMAMEFQPGRLHTS